MLVKKRNEKEDKSKKKITTHQKYQENCGRVKNSTAIIFLFHFDAEQANTLLHVNNIRIHTYTHTHMLVRI